MESAFLRSRRVSRRYRALARASSTLAQGPNRKANYPYRVRVSRPVGKGATYRRRGKILDLAPRQHIYSVVKTTGNQAESQYPE